MQSANIYSKQGTDPIPPFTLVTAVAVKFSGIPPAAIGPMRLGEAVAIFDRYAKAKANQN